MTSIDPGPASPAGSADPVPVLPGPRPIGSETAPPLPGGPVGSEALRPPPGGPDPAPAPRAPAPDPFPPPFRWANRPPGVDAERSADATQVVPGGSGEPTGPAEATRVLRGRATGRGWSAPDPPTSTEETRVVPGAVVARASVAPAAATAPPWSAVRAPTGPAGGPSGQLQRRQGAELFVREGPKPAVLISTTLVVILAALVVVLSVVLT